MSSMTETEARAEYIAGLRALADYLERTPGMPIPSCATDIQVSVLGEVDDEVRREVVEVSRSTGLRLTSTSGCLDDWTVSTSFGPVTYAVRGLSRARMAKWNALTSYQGAVSA